jgi:hypothetical protein
MVPIASQRTAIFLDAGRFVDGAAGSATRGRVVDTGDSFQGFVDGSA